MTSVKVLKYLRPLVHPIRANPPGSVSSVFTLFPEGFLGSGEDKEHAEGDARVKVVPCQGIKVPPSPGF